MCRITLLLLAMLAGGYSVADEIEEPAWQLVKQLDEVEIRQYAPTIQAAVHRNTLTLTSSSLHYPLLL